MKMKMYYQIMYILIFFFSFYKNNTNYNQKILIGLN